MLHSDVTANGGVIGEHQNLSPATNAPKGTTEGRMTCFRRP